MKLTLFFSNVILISLVLSCNDQQKATTAEKELPKTSSTNCYRYINNNDTVVLNIKDVDGIVTGSLVYNLFQKDKNTGTIEGKMKGVLLIADYLFLSEGVKSVRQVAFKKTGNTFTEGFGESEEKNGKTTFKNADALDFTHSMVLTAYDCEK
jgi:hypothetical protein